MEKRETICKKINDDKYACIDFLSDQKEFVKDTYRFMNEKEILNSSIPVKIQESLSGSKYFDSFKFGNPNDRINKIPFIISLIVVFALLFLLGYYLYFNPYYIGGYYIKSHIIVWGIIALVYLFINIAIEATKKVNEKLTPFSYYSGNHVVNTMVIYFIAYYFLNSQIWAVVASLSIMLLYEFIEYYGALKTKNMLLKAFLEESHVNTIYDIMFHLIGIIIAILLT